jgi:hypothetical protein
MIINMKGVFGHSSFLVNILPEGPFLLPEEEGQSVLAASIQRQDFYGNAFYRKWNKILLNGSGMFISRASKAKRPEKDYGDWLINLHCALSYVVNISNVLVAT